MRRLVAIDLLRGLAVLAVVVAHLPFSWEGSAYREGSSPSPWLRHILEYGQFGVTLFLVISGFCIHMAWVRQADPTQRLSFADFWKRRLYRLYPAYLVALLMTLAASWFLHAGIQGQRASLAGMFGYAEQTQLLLDLGLALLLCQNWNGASHRLGNAPFWSLALEEQLYMLYFPLLWLRRRGGWKVAFAVAFLTSIGWRLLTPAASSLVSGWLILGPARWIEWALGAYAAEVHFGSAYLPRAGRSLGVALLFFGLALSLTPPAQVWPSPLALACGDLAWALAFFVSLNWLCRRERDGRLGAGPWTSRLARIGLISYSIYLVHNPIMIAVKRLALQVGVSSTAGVMGLRLAAALAGGWLFYMLVERRFLHSPRIGAPADDSKQSG